MRVFFHAPENDEKRGHTIDPVAVARQDDKHEDQAPHHGSGSPWEQFDSGDTESYDHTSHILHQPRQEVEAFVWLLSAQLLTIKNPLILFNMFLGM